jgi:hypothetical protein
MQTNWWDEEPADIKEIARRMCKSLGSAPDNLCIGFEPMQLNTSSGPAFHIPDTALRPLWTFNIAAARDAVECRDMVVVENVVDTTEPEDVKVWNSNELWRKAIGLTDDGSPD